MKLLIGFIIALTGGFSLAHADQNSKIKTYVITETSINTSFDPLDADQTPNLPVARMIYATPVEINSDDNISSSVLESFKYDKGTKSLVLNVKPGLKFSNAADLTVDDVAFSIVRMAFTRPDFPVLDKIEGLKDWAQSTDPLKTRPKGVEIAGNKITVRFSEEVKHPLFRLCLELFSIIPKSCVDLKTNKISCSEIPASGPYRIVKKDKETILFSKRSNDLAGPEQIQFKYIGAGSLVSQLGQIDEASVVAGNEMLFTNSEMAALKQSGKISFLPASRFAALVINPTVNGLGDKMCRQYLSEAFRAAFKEINHDFSPVEGSIFTKLIPGYMSQNALSEKEVSRITATQKSTCLEKIRKSQVQWGYVEGEKNTAYFQTLTVLFKKLEIKDNKPVLFASRKEMFEAFYEGKIALAGVSSGFWAHDPSGDLQMLFTPNLHKILSFVSRDGSLQKLIKDVVKESESQGSYKVVNQYLFDESLFNVYTHIRRFYFTKNNSYLKKPQLGMSAPNPWQVFE